MQSCVFLFVRDRLCSPLWSHEMPERKTLRCLSFEVLPIEEEGHWHMMTADVRVGVSLCIIDEQNGNKNMLLVWTVTPGCDPTEIRWGFYTHSMMNVFKLSLPSLPAAVEISIKVSLPPQTGLKETNIIKIGNESLFWDDLKFLCGGIINLFYCILGFSSETEPESPRITFLPSQMYWCKPKPKLPVRSCWANFLLGVDETLKSPLQRSCLRYY